MNLRRIDDIRDQDRAGRRHVDLAGIDCEHGRYRSIAAVDLPRPVAANRSRDRDGGASRSFVERAAVEIAADAHGHVSAPGEMGDRGAQGGQAAADAAGGGKRDRKVPDVAPGDHRYVSTGAQHALIEPAELDPPRRLRLELETLPETLDRCKSARTR